MSQRLDSLCSLSPQVESASPWRRRAQRFVLAVGAMLAVWAPAAHATVTCSTGTPGVVACTLDTWADLKTTIESQPTGTTLNITITADLTATSTITLVGGETVTIASDTGQRVALRDPALAAAPLFSVGATAAATETLTLQDVVLDGNKGVVTNCTAPLITTAGSTTATLAVINLRGASALRNNANTNPANSAASVAAIYVGQLDALNMYDTAQISGNSSVSHYVSGGAYLSTSATMTMHNSASVSGNTAYGDSASGGYGGGIRLGGSAHLDMYDSSKVSGNKAQYGAGIYSGTGSQITMHDNSSVTGNQAVLMVPTVYAWGGGGLYVSGGNLTMTDNASVSGNTSAGDAGGILATNGANVTIKGSAKLSDNQGQIVGGIYLVTNCSLTVQDNAEVSGNVGASYSGGIDINTGGALRITGNAKIINNSTTGCYDDTALTGMCLGAGGIYINAHVISGSPPVIVGSASVDVLIDGNAVISGNTAFSNGGGIYIDYFEDHDLSSLPVRVQGNVQITNNSAPNGDGGGIYVGVYDDIANPGVRDPQLYYRLSVGADVVFANNSAQAAYLLTDPALIAIHDATVLTHSFTTPFTYGYNNYDINYIEGTLIYIVTFDSQGGTPVEASNPAFVGNAERVAPSALAIRPPVDPTRNGYTFRGWCVAVPTATSPCVPYNFGTQVTSNFTLYANWTPALQNGGPASVPAPGWPAIPLLAAFGLLTLWRARRRG